jgi:hypothetical protein
LLFTGERLVVMHVEGRLFICDFFPAIECVLYFFFFFYHSYAIATMHSRTRNSPPRTRTTPRTTPLRKETSHDSSRTINTPPRGLTSDDFEDPSPINFHRSQSGLGEGPSPFFDHSEDLRQFEATPQYGGDHVSVDSTDDSEPLIATDQNISRNLIVTDHSFSSGKQVQQTREDRLRILRQDAMNNFLPGTACFIGEKLMVSTGK